MRLALSVLRAPLLCFTRTRVCHGHKRLRFQGKCAQRRRRANTRYSTSTQNGPVSRCPPCTPHHHIPPVERTIHVGVFLLLASAFHNSDVRTILLSRQRNDTQHSRVDKLLSSVHQYQFMTLIFPTTSSSSLLSYCY